MDNKKFIGEFIKFLTNDNRKGVGKVYLTEDDNLDSMVVGCVLKEGWTSHISIDQIKNIEVINFEEKEDVINNG